MSRKQHLRGGAMPDELKVLQVIAKQSYNLTDPIQNVDGWKLVSWTPTMKFYMKGKDVIVGVRGTKTQEDVGTWYTIPFDLLYSTGVYQRDEAELRAFQQEYPPDEYNYYAVGHSLGGAIIDNLIRRGLIKEATSYNPAIEYSDINRGLPHRRIYYGNDPLYRIMGWYDKKSEHRDSKYGQWIDILTSLSPIPSAILGLEAHNLKNFTGGACCSSCKDDSPCGGKLKFAKKYLKGCGMPTTKKNVSKVLDAMDCEGVVFE